VLQLPGLEENQRRSPVITAVAISADGSKIAAGGDDHQVRVWNAGDGAELHALQSHGDWVRSARFSGDGRLATVAADHTVCLWRLSADSTEPAVRKLAGGALQAVAWRPDGAVLATAGFGDSLRMFDLTSGDEAAPHERPCACEDTRAVAFSPNGRWVAAAGRNGIIRMWDLAASGGPRDLPSDGRRVRALVFSPDGETLAAGGDGPAIRLWRSDASGFGAGAPDELLVRPGKVHSLAFVDERVLAVGDTQNEITLWDVETRAERLVLQGHTGTVAALATSADGRRIVSGSFDTTVRVWDIDPAGLPVMNTAANPTAQPAR
jgi:WD40 repeat protein